MNFFNFIALMKAENPVNKMACCNRKEATKILMLARSRGIVWKLLLQILMAAPSAIINAWREIEREPEPCPLKV